MVRRNDLPANVFLLLRPTGMRIGECADPAYDCLHNVGPDPLGDSCASRQLRFFRSFDPSPLTAAAGTPQRQAER